MAQLLLSAQEITDLIGGSDEYRIVMRDWVAAEIARRHLKPLINDPVIQDMITDATNAFERVARDEFAKQGVNIDYSGTTARLTTAMENALRKRVQELARHEINAAMATLNTMLSAMIESAVQEQINALTEAKIKEYVGRAVSAKMKETFR